MPKKEFQDYLSLRDSLSEANKSLILRQPQLEAVRSRVESARAAVKQAELDLQRTTVRAPFDAQILSRNVNVGSLVAPGDNLGRLVGMDTYWVEATVPQSKLRWLSFPEDDRSGSDVRIRNRTAWPDSSFRSGELFRLVGALENQSRMARVLISVPDPLAQRSDYSDEPAMMIGSFVEATIKGKELDNVIRLNRDYVRSDETVWTMEDRQLQINDVNILFSDRQYAYISEGLGAEDQVVVTNLATVVEGAPLRLESEVQDNVASADTAMQSN